MRDIMSAMTATLPSESVYHGQNLSGEKRLHGAYSVVAAFADGSMREIVTAHDWCAFSRSPSRNYASVWVSADGDSGSRSYNGHGWAGGWGYHRISAAYDYAIRDAGIQLSESIDGVGDSAMEAAFLAIARAAAPDAASFLYVRHG